MRGADRSLACALRGPVTLITVGALFALNNFTPYGFNQTWPVLLIVFGLFSLLSRAERQGQPAAGWPPPPGGHYGPYGAYSLYGPPSPYPPHPSAPPPAPPPGPGARYRQSRYGQGPATGGFGTSAAPPAPPQGGPK
ncbi:MAG TPA: DUF5668 domain-containing protein [Bryobacteraceae bacterium]|jgi:hypothetical protein|nr:DUF5668 domain-containing protein [Bryobacteraceae bacterium]